MTLALYGHPFASYVWKVLIALYERDVSFTFRRIDPEHPENYARVAQLSPTAQFPALTDGGRDVIESNAIIDYLDLFHGDAAPMIPADRKEALEARMMADLFDDYVHSPMQRIVADALRSPSEKDPRGVADANTNLERAYAWLERHMKGRDFPACGRFTLADCAAAPALFYADWVHPISRDEYPALTDYRARLLVRPSVSRVVDEARPYRSFFPLGAPDRD